MTIEIKIFGEAKDVLNDLHALLVGAGDDIYKIKPRTSEIGLNLFKEVETPLGVDVVTVSEPTVEKKNRKPKEEKVAEPKAEVLAPEKSKYTLQDAIDRAREIAGDGKDEKTMVTLKGINTRLGISKVREIPPEKLDGYMKELNAEFPKDAAATSANMFD